jgi:hypothetical protein
MVHGAVKAPLLDLANRELVESHMQAIWLACTQVALPSKISEAIALDDDGRPLKAEFLAPMQAERVRREARQRILAVLHLLGDELTSEQAPWYTSAEAFADALLKDPASTLERQFDRWRALFQAAEEQRDEANRRLRNYGVSAGERRMAEGLAHQAQAQIELLLEAKEGSEFYLYRYLATEGFLPGYNFPRLPLIAYIPAFANLSKQTYLQRPRFLALAEYGPRSLIYHEGRAYRVVRAMLTLGARQGASNTTLPVQHISICVHCGGAHFKDDVDFCHACGERLQNPEHIKNLCRIENVATKEAERITANDEERQRQGFELQTTFEWAKREQGYDVRRAEVADGQGVILKLAYGPRATITRLNKGLRRRRNLTECGFMIDPMTGYWASNADEEERDDDPEKPQYERIVPFVSDCKNALLVQPAHLPVAEVTLTTFQYAFLRGIESVFQLEQGEILAEPLPSRQVRKGFLLYEATEGGAGVLRRLLAEPAVIRNVITQALSVMHLQTPGSTEDTGDYRAWQDEPDTACVAGCYRCLLSYTNQVDHERIDRRDDILREWLVRLLHADTLNLTDKTAQPNATTTDATTTDSTDADTAALVALSDRLTQFGLLAPDPRPMQVLGVTLPLVWRKSLVAVVPADTPPAIVSELSDNLGYEIAHLAADEHNLPEVLQRLHALLGGSS